MTDQQTDRLAELERARLLTARTADHLEQVDGEWVRQSVDAPGNFIEVPEPVDGGRL